MPRIIAALVGLFLMAGALAGCATATASEPLDPDAVIVDVRTPGEYAEGHLEGAELLDLNAGEFVAALPTLDPDAAYMVYCRSGNRSAQAAQLMKDAGFTNVTDLGSLQDATNSTGIPIVR